MVRVCKMPLHVATIPHLVGRLCRLSPKKFSFYDYFSKIFFDYCDYCDYYDYSATTIAHAQAYRNLQKSVHKSLHFLAEKPLQIYDK